MIIQNYGLHWKRAEVFWGKPGPGGAGTLNGKLISKPKTESVSFKEQAGIYVLHDRFTPIYVGQAGRGGARLFGRLRGHTRNRLADRWDRFSWFGIFPVENGFLRVIEETEVIKTGRSVILDHVEGVLISISEPPLNSQGSRFGDAKQCRQYAGKPDVDDDDE